MNHLIARFNMTDGTTTTQFIAASRNTLQASKWHHIAVSFDKGAGKAITYIDGSADFTSDITNTNPLVSVTNEGYMGKTGQSGFFMSSFGGALDGNCLEVRLFPEAHDENWFSAEHNNWCDSTFLLVGDEETVSLPLT
jgi:hypothetical protein